MSAPVYRRENTGPLAKTNSSVIAGISIWQIISSGNLRGMRMAFVEQIPWLVIWFPDTAAESLGDGIRGKLASQVGWVVMISITIPLTVYWWSS